MSGRRKTGGAFADRSRARRRALQALYQWALTGHDGEAICRQFKSEQDMRRVDVDYFEDLVSQTLARRAEIEAKLIQHLDRDLERLDPMEASILRLAAYELLYHPEIPFRAVLDEAVGLGSDFGSAQTPGYVNGVLDRCAADWRDDEYQR